MCYDPGRARFAWAVWERVPERAREASCGPRWRASGGGCGSTRRCRGARPSLPPADAVELDTAIGTLWFDSADEHLTPWIRSQGVWEADVMKLLARFLRPGSLFVDVGANVGFHAVFGAQLGAHVVAVEPVPWTLELLRANVWRHGADVEVVAAAASDGLGTVRIAAGCRTPVGRTDRRHGDRGARGDARRARSPGRGGRAEDRRRGRGAAGAAGRLGDPGAQPGARGGRRVPATSRTSAASHPERCSRSTSRSGSSCASCAGTASWSRARGRRCSSGHEAVPIAEPRAPPLDTRDHGVQPPVAPL